MEALDGNAIAGALHVAFGREMTTALGTCAACGTTNPLAKLHVYLRAPGAVARCPACGEVQLVLLEARGLVCVDLRGLTALSERSSNVEPTSSHHDPGGTS
jgi:Family of unknown function (DUF6510)